MGVTLAIVILTISGIMLSLLQMGVLGNLMVKISVPMVLRVLVQGLIFAVVWVAVACTIVSLVK